ncbi:hypothetical protein KIPB_004107 [Kipferlia bialata]|uniref:Uncharacterized protein n=1 Tax=Kipferlia bialata TaxID=797122 RepID=A0A9K3CVI2_9EUKA|nr:hypothetical protein KIPB_004107 [Kipferlia bialata]|eukprot:g4107.t1
MAAECFHVTREFGASEIEADSVVAVGDNRFLCLNEDGRVLMFTLSKGKLGLEKALPRQPWNSGRSIPFLEATDVKLVPSDWGVVYALVTQYNSLITQKVATSLDLYVLHLDTLRWRRVRQKEHAPRPSARQPYLAGCVDGGLIVAGGQLKERLHLMGGAADEGEEEGSVALDVWRLDAETERWRRLLISLPDLDGYHHCQHVTVPHGLLAVIPKGEVRLDVTRLTCTFFPEDLFLTGLAASQPVFSLGPHVATFHNLPQAGVMGLVLLDPIGHECILSSLLPRRIFVKKICGRYSRVCTACMLNPTTMVVVVLRGRDYDCNESQHLLLVDVDRHNLISNAYREGDRDHLEYWGFFRESIHREHRGLQEVTYGPETETLRQRWDRLACAKMR